MDIAELEKIAEEGREARKTLDALAAEREQKEALQHVGKCFRYSNSYGGDEERWWVYIKITGVGAGSFKTCEFQRTAYNHIQIEPTETKRFGFIKSVNYKEITPAEWTEAWDKLRAEINAL